MEKVLARGRVLGNSNSEFTRMLKNDRDVKTFTLKSGKQAKFVKTIVLGGEIELKVFVDASANGRSQAMLSRESVTDISRTIKLQQFFPTTDRGVNGRIEILDDTRHQATCIYDNVKFEILVTKDDIDLAGAKQLVRDIQATGEHSLRELGKQSEVTYRTSTTKEEVILAENISSAEVARAFQAAPVPDEMISVFPVVNGISLSDYQPLLKLSEEAGHKKTSVKELTGKVRQRLIALPDYPTIDKNKILSVFRAESKTLMEPPAKTVETEKLKEFADRNQSARRKTDSKKRLVIYEFSHMSSEMQSEIDEAIKRILEKLSSSGGQKFGKKDTKWHLFFTFFTMLF